MRRPQPADPGNVVRLTVAALAVPLRIKQRCAHSVFLRRQVYPALITTGCAVGLVVAAMPVVLLQDVQLHQPPPMALAVVRMVQL